MRIAGWEASIPSHCVLPSGELRSNSCGKPDHEVRVSCGTRTHPRPCASRRSQQGWGAGSERLLLRSCAGCRFALCAADGWGAMALPGPSAAKAQLAERSNGPYGARSHPLLTVPRSAGPGVSACRRTHASSSGSPKLFDRSCLAEAAQGVLRRHPRTEHRRLPHSPPGEWGHGQRGRLLFGDFLLATQEKVTAPPGAHPASAFNKGMR